MPGEGRYQLKLISMLQKALGGTKVEIINRGVSGEVAASAAERMRLLAAMVRPNLVLWQVGTNDALARVEPSDFEATVRDTIRWLRDHQIDVVLVGLQYSSHLANDPAYVAIRQAVARVAQEEHVLHIRRFNAMQLIAKTQGAEAEISDELAASNSCMAEHIATAVIANLYLRKKPPQPGLPPQQPRAPRLPN
jgi:lysophospholipase L1-like esterase